MLSHRVPHQASDTGVKKLPECRWLNALSNGLQRLIEVAVFLLFVAMVVLVFAQVYTRFLTNNSLTWSEELSRFLMVWMVFLGSALTFHKGGHITVDNLVKTLPSRVKPIVEMAACLLMLLFLLVLVWGATTVLPTTALQKSPANNIVMAYVYAAIPLSAVLMGIDVIRTMVRILLTKGGKTP